jgi:hypothetical protein
MARPLDSLRPFRWACGPLDDAIRLKSQTLTATAESAHAAWLKPQSLDLLGKTGWNTIVVLLAAGLAEDAAQPSALKPLLTEAKRRGLEVIGMVQGGGKAPSDLDIPILSLNPPEGDSVPAEAICGYCGPLRRQPNRDLPIVALTRMQWPGIRLGEEGGAAKGGPTGNPWIEDNIDAIRVARLRASSSQLWLLHDPPPKHALEASAYALAFADAALGGARWVTSLDDSRRAALAQGDTGVRAELQRWDSIQIALEKRLTTRKLPPRARLMVCSHFLGLRHRFDIELLHLLTRRHVPYRLSLPLGVNAADWDGISTILLLDSDPPPERMIAAAKALLDRGGLVIMPPALGKLFPGGDLKPSVTERFQLRDSGNGQVAIPPRPWGNPYLAAGDIHHLMSRQQDRLRLFNGGALSVQLVEDRAKGRVVAQIVNFTGRAAGDDVTMHVAGRFRDARCTTFGPARSRPLEMTASRAGVELPLPKFEILLEVELSEIRAGEGTV